MRFIIAPKLLALPNTRPKFKKLSLRAISKNSPQCRFEKISCFTLLQASIFFHDTSKSKTI